MKNYFDQAPCLYFSSADDGTVIDVNETLCTKLGYTKDELLGQKADVIFTLPTRIFHQTHFFPLLKMQGHAEEIYITLQAKNKNQIPVLLNAERKVINGEAVILHTGIIVLNRKKFEDELIAAKKAAEAALHENTALVQAKQELQKHMEELDQQIRLVNKQNEELRQFNRVVTHDLQEPLRKISVFASMVLEDGDKQNQKKATGNLVRVSEQMRSIVSGLQQFVWLTETPIKPTQVHLNVLLRAVQQQLEKEYPQVKLVIETEELEPVQADRDHMHLLFYQLLSNAIRFRKPGNEVHVSLSANSLLLNIFQNIEGKYKYSEFVRLQVKDYGIGFDIEYKEQVFELFKRLHPVSGLGVGLSLCKKIIENHQGSITIDSKAGEGTTVTVLLPKKPKESI
ncbi:MAG: PAS domain-containing protein [Chitinophagaceae bacterium]|nr:PAS domain-containing protein [Chitinophagaceae bacterium]